MHTYTEETYTQTHIHTETHKATFIQKDTH